MRVALFATALLAASVEARAGSYHRKVVRNTRQQLEHTYGAVMTGLWNEKGSMTPRTLALDAQRHERRAGRKLINYGKRTVLRQTDDENNEDGDENGEPNTSIIEDTIDEVTLFMDIGGLKFDAL